MLLNVRNPTSKVAHRAEDFLNNEGKNLREIFSTKPMQKHPPQNLNQLEDWQKNCKI